MSKSAAPMRGRVRDLLPDLITMARLPLAAIFPLVVARPLAAIAVILAAGATDVADGWAARALGRVTAGGARLDVVADKTFIAAVAVALVSSGKLALGAAVLLGTREIGELVILVLAATRRRPAGHVDVTSSVAGKLTTTLQFTVAIAVILGWEVWRPLLGAAAACGALAAIGYSRQLRAKER